MQRNHMFIVAGIIGFIVIAFIVVKNMGSGGQQTIVPATPKNSGQNPTANDLQSMLSQIESSMQGSNSDLASNISTALADLQTQVQSMPAGATQSQLNDALASLMTNINTAISTGNSDSITSINQSLAAMQSAITQSGATNTSSVLDSLNNLQNLITTNSQNLTNINTNVNSLSTWLQAQIGILNKMITGITPKLVAFTTQDINNFNHFLSGIGGFNSGISSNQQQADFIQTFRTMFPQYNSLVSGTTLENIAYSIYDLNGPMHGKITTNQQFADYLNSQLGVKV